MPLEFEAGDHVFLKVVPDYEEDWTNSARDCFATSLGKPAQCLPCIIVEEVHCRCYPCAGGGRCTSVRRSDNWSWTSVNLRFSSQANQGEGDLNCEGPLG